MIYRDNLVGVFLAKDFTDMSRSIFCKDIFRRCKLALKKTNQDGTVNHLFHKTYNAKHVHCTSLDMKILITMPVLPLLIHFLRIYFMTQH